MSPAETITTCACGYRITRGDWQASRLRGEAKVQIFDDEPVALEMIACPACGSHRSIEIPRFRPMTDRPWTLESTIDYVDARRRREAEAKDLERDAISEFSRRRRRMLLASVALRTAVVLTATIAILIAVGSWR